MQRDHPRVCGKNVEPDLKMVKYLGSPPRVREKLIPFFTLTTANRITPACAGKTANKIVCFSLRRDHPRVCGKNTVSNIPSRVAVGSPPRVREKLLHATLIVYGLRITPACAGKTQSNPTGAK